MDKAEWGEGPWQSEADRVEFKAHGLPCLLKRNQFGVWCMYVGVPAGHAWHGKLYQDIDVGCHGGLTYSAQCDGDPVDGICHVPDPGEPEHAWWLGADFGHAFDVCPAIDAKYPAIRGGQGRYWTQEEVQAQCVGLARACMEAS